MSYDDSSAGYAFDWPPHRRGAAAPHASMAPAQPAAPMHAFFPEVAAGGFSRMDATIDFYQRIHSLLHPNSIVLDFGAGRGLGHTDDACEYRRRLLNLRGTARKVIGADVDPIVFENPGLDKALLLGPEGRIPLPDNSVDLIVADFVLEHLADPRQATRELSRVLTQGGWLCIRTTNRFGYVALGNRIVPASMRAALLRRLQPNRRAEDVFPAYYRINTKTAIDSYFPKHRFTACIWHRDAEPSYHANSKLMFAMMNLSHAITPAKLKTFIFAFIRKD